MFLLVPVVVSKVNDYGYQHGEGLVLIGLEYVQEVIVLKEAHCSISHLKMNTANAFDDSFEKLRNEVLHLVHFAHFKNLLEFSEEKGFLDAIGKWPVLEEAFQQRNCQCSILCEEKH